MQVAVVTPRYPPVSGGGGEQSAWLLATQLADCDRITSVTVFSFDGNGTTHRAGVKIERFGSVSPTITELQNLVVSWKLRGRISEFDIVHAYNMELHPVVGYLASKVGVPSVGTLNSYHFFPSSITNTTASGLERLYEVVGFPTTGRVLRHCMKRIDAFVALSRAIKEIYVTHGFADARIEHIPNMIDPSFEVPDGVGAGYDGVSLLYVGALSEKKGVQYLVKAMALLPETHRLRVVGDGEQASELRELAADLEVTDRIDFAGRIPYEEISHAYARADLFVHPGIWPEPLNRTVLEAMQAGLPVVCTNIGGPPEVIQHEELLCSPADPEGLATAIKHAMQQPDDFGEQNQQYVLENHSPSTIISSIVNVYSSLLE